MATAAVRPVGQVPENSGVADGTEARGGAPNGPVRADDRGTRAANPPTTSRGVLNALTPSDPDPVLPPVSLPHVEGFEVPATGAAARIDWLEWTVFDRDWAAVQATLYPGEWVERPVGAMGYLRSWAARDAVAFTDGQPGMGIHVRMSGRAVAELANDAADGADPVDWWAETQAAASHLTRLDVAWDDIAADGPGLLDIGRMRRELEADHAVMRARTWRPMVEYQRRAGGQEVVGETLYIGRRGGSTFIRVYDKRAEQLAKLARDDPKRAALPAHWIRVEMELRHEAADAMLAVLREEGWAGAAEVLRGHLDFRVPTADKTRTRWPVADWWQAFTGAAATASLGLTRHVSSARRSIAWVEDQVAATVALLVDAGGGVWLRHALDAARRRTRTAGARRRAEAEAWFQEHRYPVATYTVA